MDYKNILYSTESHRAIITINRPKKLNALNTDTFKELNDALILAENNDQVRGLIISGAGDKAFVAGADINEIQPLSKEQGTKFSRLGQQVFNRIENLNKPVIALIDGFALGGGCELAMACHLRIATENSKFGQPEINLGLIPGYAATQRLPRLIGRGLALELLLTADMITAERAYQIGLVNRITPASDLLSTGEKILDQIASKSPLIVKYLLDCVRRGLDVTLDKGQLIEADYFGLACSSEDMKEGTSAFLEKRKPDFKGR